MSYLMRGVRWVVRPAFDERGSGPLLILGKGVGSSAHSVERKRVVISSLVVETVLDYTEAVAQKLPSYEGVEVHGIDGYKIIITIEAPTVDESHATANAISTLAGVIGVDLIYLNFEDDPTIFPNGV